MPCSLAGFVPRGPVRGALLVGPTILDWAAVGRRGFGVGGSLWVGVAG